MCQPPSKHVYNQFASLIAFLCLGFTTQSSVPQIFPASYTSTTLAPFPNVFNPNAQEGPKVRVEDEK